MLTVKQIRERLAQSPDKGLEELATKLDDRQIQFLIMAFRRAAEGA